MFKKKIYKYKENNRTIVSPYKPNCEYEEIYRLIAQNENYLLTDYTIFTSCIDVTLKDLELWVEVSKEDLNVPIPQIDELSKKVKALEEFNVDIVATTWDMDFRIYEIEWLLEDTGILVSEININNKVKVGNYTMATLTKYEQAKIIILGGNYNETVLTRQLESYLKRNIITQDEYEELISLMNARELVEHK